MGMMSFDIGVDETRTTTDGISSWLQGPGSAYADFTWAPSATAGSLNNGQSFQ